MKQIKLALVDDDLLIVTLLADCLQQEADFEVVYKNTNGNEFLDFVKSNTANHPDIVILDLKMDAISGLEVIAQLKTFEHHMNIIVVSSHYQPNSIKFMLDQGVSAFLPKGITPHQLMIAVRKVASQGFYWDDKQLHALSNLIQKKSVKPVMNVVEELTTREIEILKCLCFQKTAKEIGELLFISQRTVEGHKGNLLIKIGVKNVMGLVVFALQNNIVSLEELPLI